MSYTLEIFHRASAEFATSSELVQLEMLTMEIQLTLLSQTVTSMGIVRDLISVRTRNFNGQSYLTI
jgi:hypothetical protein